MSDYHDWEHWDRQDALFSALIIILGVGVLALLLLTARTLGWL